MADSSDELVNGLEDEVREVTNFSIHEASLFPPIDLQRN